MTRTQRQKLLNAILYFAANTHGCGKIKLIKLLYLLDFAHFRETGASVTGLEYRAWKLGPVPVEFFEEWELPGDDFQAAVDIVSERVIDYTRQEVRPRRAPDLGWFTRRELRLMESLADRFRDDLSKPMVNVTHVESGPWSKIWDQGRGHQQVIPYSLAVPDAAEDRDAVFEHAETLSGISAAASARH